MTRATVCIYTLCYFSAKQLWAGDVLYLLYWAPAGFFFPSKVKIDKNVLATIYFFESG